MAGTKNSGNGPGALKRRAELRLGRRRRPPASVPGTEADVRRLLQELEVHRVELEMQNEELQLRRAELELALAKYTDLYDFAPTGYFSLDKTGTIRECNLAGAALLGGPRGEVVARRLGSFLEADSLPALEAFLRETWQGEQKATCEVRCQPRGLPAAHVRLEGVTLGTGDTRVLRVAAIDITERVRGEAERIRLSAAVEQVGEAIVIADADGVIRYVNPAFEAAHGWSRAEAVGRRPSDLGTATLEAGLEAAQTSRRTWHGRVVARRKDGGRMVVDEVVSAICDAAGAVSHYVAIGRNVTAELEREAELQQARRMESVGRLAGGVAHDVNNLLTPVMCYAEQIASEAGDGSSFLEPAQEILAASRRVRDLVKQLMAFGRVQMLDIRPTSLNTVVSNLERLLRRMLRDDVELVTSLADELPPVLADRTQIDQVVMNLVVNAQDAMPGGGQISIATSHVDVASPPAGAPAELRPGRYACLVVRDNGVGMDPSTRDRVFEPFFTTKEQGKGTGLGLATVYGIVMQHAGHVTVESARDLGTTFRVYWPLVLASPAHPPVPEPDTTPPGGSETILVVEDNPQVRKMVARLLTGLGYSVIVAGSAAEAIGLAAVQGEPIHLLFTDVIMPGGNGVALFDALAPQFPGLKVLYMSGYPRDVAGLREVLDESTPFIEKPFSAARLAVQVRAVIDGDGPAPASTR